MGEENPPTVKVEHIRELLMRQNVFWILDPDDMQTRILKETSDVVAKTVPIISKKSRLSSEVHHDWKKENNIPIFKKGRKGDLWNYKLVSLRSMPGKS